ncbi:MAG: PAS domain-containing sensor histidine kinase [Candidatus Bathyarchaeia archaeon]
MVKDFIKVKLNKVDDGIGSGLRTVSKFIRTNRGYIFQFSDHNKVERKRPFNFITKTIPMVVVDNGWKILEINSKMEEITGFRREELLRRNLLKIMTIKSKLILIKNMIKQMIDMHVAPYEIEVFTKNGGKIPCEVTATKTIYKDKLANLIIFRDITERKKMAKALQESEKKFRFIFENTEDAVFLVDAKTGLILNCNKAATALLERSKKEIIGQHQTMLYPPQRAEYYVSGFKKRLERKGVIDEKVEIITKSGQTKVVLISASLISIEGRQIILEIFKDTIERKKAQEIIEDKEKFEELFLCNPEPTVYLDSSLRILDANPTFCELFGYTIDELKGNKIENLILPDDRKEEEKALNKIVKKGPVYEHDTLRKTKDGFLIPVSISAAPVIVNGKIRGYIEVYKNISQLKSAERQLKNMIETSKLMNEKLRVVGRLTRHDVRNKLTAIAGNVYLLKKRVGHNQEAMKYLADIESIIKQIEKIFEFARTYEALGAEELVYQDVGKVINEAISLFSDLRGVKVINNCGGLVLLSDSLLRQLFYNLIDNSLKYGEKVSEIKIYFEVEAGCIKLIYEDNGVGISPEMKPHLFKEGYGKGTGYGLFLIKKITEFYGWTIQENGKYMEGARFTITIPRVNKEGKENYEIHWPNHL